MTAPGGTLAWQRRLLPLMVLVLLVLAALACLSNIYQVGIVQAQAMETDDKKLDFTPVWQSFDASLGGSLAYAQWKTAIMLESGAMHRRYHQAGAMTLTRIYIVFLGFMSGMVMSLIGATFILGKLETPESRLEAEAPGWKMALLTSSPGILLAMLGTILMIVTILSRAEIGVTDAALYLPRLDSAEEGRDSKATWDAKRAELEKLLDPNAKQP